MHSSTEAMHTHRSAREISHEDQAMRTREPLWFGRMYVAFSSSYLLSIQGTITALVQVRTLALNNARGHAFINTAVRSEAIEWIQVRDRKGS